MGDREAAVYPAVLVVLPLCIAMGTSPVLSVLSDAPLMGVGLTSALLVAALYVGGTFARLRGKKVQDRLLQKWDCFPTTQYLRHSDETLPSQTRDRYRSYLERGVGKLPSRASESRNTAKADEAYDDAVNWLKEQRRGPEFTLLLKEDSEYGFRRNTRGLKPHGLAALIASVTLSAALYRVPVEWPPPSLPVGLWATIAVSVVLASLWIFVVNDEWVRAAAEQYAKTLLATCDVPEKASR